MAEVFACQCGAQLTYSKLEASPVGYYRCPRCDRQFATSYANELRRASRARTAVEPGADDQELSELKSRLSRWLSRFAQPSP